MNRIIRSIKMFGLVASAAALLPLAAAAQQALTADVVVVGGGGSGLAAAVSAAQHGAKVVLLEKEANTGGATQFAEGLFGIETEETRMSCLPLTKQQMYMGAMEFNHHRGDARLVYTVIDESKNTIKWLETFGLSVRPTTISTAEPAVWHVFKEYKGVEHGAALVKALREQADALGVKVLTSTPATGLILENGKIAGIKATDASGKPLTVRAKAVVLATGGFGNNKEMIAKYTRFDPESVFTDTPMIGKTGDGIQMAFSAGADSDHRFGLLMHTSTNDPSIAMFSNLYTMNLQPFLWVNQHGDRFDNEGSLGSFAIGGNMVEGQRGHYIWSIFDDDTVKYEETQGIDNAFGVIIPIGTKMSHLRKDMAKAERENSASFKSADTIEELAAKIGADPVRLRTSVDHYNQWSVLGQDREFYKEARFLQPVKKGPFHALKVVPGFFGSMGGILVDTRFRALNDKDEAIPGLYMAGLDVGGAFGDTYTLFTSGFALSMSTTSGRISGADAAAFATQSK